MEQKINIAELLKDCPKGMELDCILFNNTVKYDGLDGDDSYPIEIITENDDYFYITKEGYLYNTPNSKCVIFPKGKTTWEGFQRPFKDGDIVTTDSGEQVFILQRAKSNTEGYCYIGYDFGFNELYDASVWGFERFATEEEKERLFKAIKDNGYRWNAETKTLEKLIEPKFKVGDKIEKCGYRFTIKEVREYHYLTKCGNKIPIDNQDDFSLVPNKFDITTLKPFDKVLVRDGDTYVWEAHLFSRYYKNSDKPYICIGVEVLNEYRQCIPYDSNKELLGTTNDCDDYYKTWE